MWVTFWLRVLTFLTQCLVWDLDDRLVISSVLTSISVLYYEQLYGLPFWNFFTVFSGFLGILFACSLARNLWFSYLLCCTVYDCVCVWGQMAGRQRAESGVWPTLCGLQLHWLEKENASSSEFWLLQAYGWLPPVWEDKERGEGGICALWALLIPCSGLWAGIRAFSLWALCVCARWSLLWCCWRYAGSAGMLNSSPAQWTFKFWSSLICLLLFAFQSS